MPPGFVVTTAAYHAFTAANGLDGALTAALDDPQTAPGTITVLRSRFDGGVMPDQVVQAISDAYTRLGRPTVAVRSSATAEDLPTLSFAGQHDSVLNVDGDAALLSAVRRCWASLWSERALSYRRDMGVGNDAIAMAVIVQTMVDADASGVLFTANPVTGARDEVVVNAGAGLGEAIVGGALTTASLTLDRKSGALRATERAPDTNSDTGAPPLTSAQLQHLTALAIRAESAAGGIPQDIEWVVAGEHIWLVQSRPITGLPAEPGPAVAWAPPSDTARLVRRQVVENMPLPLSALFEELYLHEGLDRGMDQLISIMRLPVDLDEFVRRPLFITVNGYGYCRYDFTFSRRMLKVIPKVLIWYAKEMPGFFRNLVPIWREQGLDVYRATIESWRTRDAQSATDTELLDGIRELALADARYWFFITMMVGAAKISEGALNWFLHRGVRGNVNSGELLGGYSSPTLDAQAELGRLATVLSTVEAEYDAVAHAATLPDLRSALRSQPRTRDLARSLDRYVATYGHQAYNLDFADPTQGEDQHLLLSSLRTRARGPEVLVTRQRALARRREATEHRIDVGLGPIRRRVFRQLVSWAREFGPYREEALFYMGAAWPTLRKLARELGSRLHATGSLASADHFFFLTSGELRDASTARAIGNSRADLAALAAERWHEREARKMLHPPGRVPVDLRFKVGPLDVTRLFEIWETQKRNDARADTLTGFAVSAGTVTAPASVVRSPADFDTMTPGSILVCPTTTPAWTPLFSEAAGLVTDIGALLAHGSIVAREYGIPAVLGTGHATQRISTGQLVRVDGTAGTVTIVPG